MRILTRHIKLVQSLADISRSAQCCHSNETRAPIANPPNCARPEGTPLPFHPTYVRVREAVWETDERYTNTQTHRRP